MPRLCLVAVAATCLALAGPGPAQAGFPGSNGRIAVTTDISGCSMTGIATVFARGSRLRPLTPCRSGFFWNPAWTVSGGQALLNTKVFREDGSADVRVMSVRADGTHLRALPVPFGEAPYPAPSGERLVYEREGSVRWRPDIWIVNDDGSGLRRLRPGTSPKFSPNGRRIAFIAPGLDEEGKPVPRASQGLFIMSTTGELVRRVAGPQALGFDWAPDGRRLVYGTGREYLSGDPQDIFTVRSNGRGRKRLTATPRKDEVWPAWSPDGRRIAFVRRIPRNVEDDSPKRQVVTMPAEGGPARIVATLPASSKTEHLYPNTLSWQPRPRGR